MAGFGNYSLVVNSRFDPLSFQDMVTPYLMYKQEYDTQQSALSELQTKASVWDNMANRSTDPRTYAQYKDYADSLWKQANNLASSGLNAGTRTALMNLKARYSSDISPIENAYNRREKLKEEQRQGKAKGLIYDYDAATTSLDNFVFDNQKDYDSIDLNTLYTKSAQTFGNIAKELSDYGKGKTVDSYTNTFVQRHGITREQAAAFAEGVRNGNVDTTNPVFQALKAPYDSLYGGTNVASWNNSGASARVRDTILAGMESAIGQTNVNTIDNYGARLAAQEASQRRMVDYKNSGAGAGDANNNIERYGKRNIYTAQELGKLKGEQWAYRYLEDNGYLKNTSKGRPTLTDTAKQQYVSDSQNAKYNYTGMRSNPESNLERAISILGIKEMAKGRPGEWQWAHLASIRDSQDPTTQYDATKSTEYYRSVGDNEQEAIVSRMMSQSMGNNGKISSYKWDRERNADGSYSPKLVKDKDVDVSKIDTKKISGAEVVTGKHGNYYRIWMNDGETEYNIPITDLYPDYDSRTARMAPSWQSFNDLDINNAISYDIDEGVRRLGVTVDKNRQLDQ